MSAAVLKELVEEKALILPLRVKQFHAMIAAGILPEGEPYELLDGYVVRKDRSAAGDDPMTVGYDHAWAVTTLGDLNRRLQRLGCHMRVQQPVTLPPYNEPEPDGALVIGDKDDYRDRHPAAKDVLCVIEVADASLRHDRTIKARIYASNAIPQYVIINLPDRVIEVYAQPVRRTGRYASVSVLHPGQRVALPAARGRTLSIPVRGLLP